MVTKYGTKVLLVCGILSSLLYVAMNVFVPMLFEGYSLASQTVSELSAIGAFGLTSTRNFQSLSPATISPPANMFPKRNRSI